VTSVTSQSVGLVGRHECVRLVESVRVVRQNLTSRAATNTATSGSLACWVLLKARLVLQIILKRSQAAARKDEEFASNNNLKR